MGNYESRKASADKKKSNLEAGDQKEANLEANRENRADVDERTRHIEQGKAVADAGIRELKGLILECGEAAYHDATGIQSEAVTRVLSETHEPADEAGETTKAAGEADVDVGAEAISCAEQFDAGLEAIEEAYSAGAGEGAGAEGLKREKEIGDPQIEDGENTRNEVERGKQRVDQNKDLDPG